MFIVRSRSAPRDKPAPTFLYGYGGFNISITPSFSVARLLFVKVRLSHP
jgi:prolyl oligopeptidase